MQVYPKNKQPDLRLLIPDHISNHTDLLHDTHSSSQVIAGLDLEHVDTLFKDPFSFPLVETSQLPFRHNDFHLSSLARRNSGLRATRCYKLRLVRFKHWPGVYFH